MSTNYTENYNLSQWEKSDKVLMEDFNADNAKIDAAIKAEADARAAGDAAIETALGLKADQTALTSLQSTVTSVSGTVPKIAVGSYTGTTASFSDSASGSQKVSLPFTPKAVLVIPESSNLYNSNAGGYVYGGLAVTGCPGMFHGHTTLEIVSGGFRAHTYWASNDYSFIRLNDKDNKYHYIAWG